MPGSQLTFTGNDSVPSGGWAPRLLIISHDRYFLDQVVDRIVELDEGALTEYIGGYSDYQAAKRKT